MNKLANLALVGSGPTALFLLKHVLDSAGHLRGNITSITVLEKGPAAGYGMPYHPDTTDIHNLANISSEEIPELPESLIAWLRQQTDEALASWRMERATLSASEVYPRLAVGAYLKSQFDALVNGLEAQGVPTQVLTGHLVADIKKQENGALSLTIEGKGSLEFDSVVIATGHAWPLQDDLAHGHYFSPWPIRKLLPAAGTFINTPVGILGASLSAFDVVSSLAHRHGQFVRTDMGLKYEAFPGSEGFGLVLHSAEGWLPHLQFEQEHPLREIYRHVERERMFSLIDERGFLRLAQYFDKACRPALLEAFRKDGMEEMMGILTDEQFGFEQFVEEMTARHRYPNAFEGMGAEMVEARISVLHHKPIHWKETIDDLMYTLNFHAELLPAEDHLTFRKVVSPFLMNVIAAMPLPSGSILLALHEAGVLHLEKGRVTINDDQTEEGVTQVTIEDADQSATARYRMFVECGGQQPMGASGYPFPSLAADGNICDAVAGFSDPRAAEGFPTDRLVTRQGSLVFLTGGVGIDSAYRVIAADGIADPAIFDLAFPHTSGTRPYSYGLQACSATSRIVVEAWVEAVRKAVPVEGNLEDIATLYEAAPSL